MSAVEYQTDYNESDPNEIARIIASQANQCINMLNSPEPDNSESLLKDMVAWCQQWDRVYGYDAKELYPEFSTILDRYGYDISS